MHNVWKFECKVLLSITRTTKLYWSLVCCTTIVDIIDSTVCVDATIDNTGFSFIILQLNIIKCVKIQQPWNIYLSFGDLVIGIKCALLNEMENQSHRNLNKADKHWYL